VKKSILFFLSLLVFSSLKAHELADCRNDLGTKIEQMEQGVFHWLLLVNPEAQSWIKTGKSYLEVFRTSESYQGASEGSPESFLYWNALQSCLDFRESFDSQMLKYQWIVLGGGLLSALALALVITWRFR